MATTKDVSQHCADGKHNRCLGTVSMYPPVNGVRITACQCSDVDCTHIHVAAPANQPAPSRGARS